MHVIESLRRLGIANCGEVSRNLPPAELYEHALRRGEGTLSRHGALVVTTGRHTGRAAKDKFFVREPDTAADIWWNASAQPFDEARFQSLKARVFATLKGQDLFVTDCRAGADPAYRLSLRIVTQTAWHALFAYNMFLLPGSQSGREPEFTVVHVPRFEAAPEIDGTSSDVFIIISLAQRLALIGGTAYAGEIKKTVFTVMNHLLPLKNVLSMHCSANSLKSGGDVALFFGLSGTGKTTLSTDETRALIGDDEHGWGPDGVFNIEGGCYAKVIKLSESGEPQIFKAARMFGSIMENVVMDPLTREVDFSADTLTENTRASYPISAIEGSSPTGTAGHPKDIVMLTCDAFGVLPPIASLTPEQAQYHFLSGYTARVAGTESGVTEPRAVFSPCFGGPFLVHRPRVYAKLLGEKIEQHRSRVWLVNTGWQGGPPGVGSRIKLSLTRAMINAALSGRLDGILKRQDSVFDLMVPESCPGVPAELLRPKSSWSDAGAYDVKAKELLAMFEENFSRLQT